VMIWRVSPIFPPNPIKAWAMLVPNLQWNYFT